MDFRSSFVLVVIAIVFHSICFSHIVNYGPSIEYLTRPKTQFEQYNNLTLSKFQPTLSVLIPLVEGKASVNYTEAIKYFKNSFHFGEFQVIAPKNYGIIAVIQLLRLRKIFGESARCLDYISFRDNESNETDTPKICGEVDSDDDDFSEKPKRLLGSRTFIALSGNMTVRMSIVSVMIKSEWVGHGIEKTIGVELSFTAFPKWSDSPPSNFSPPIYHGCPKSIFGNAIQNASPHQSLRRCSNFVEHSCIHERLFCDDITQCAFDSIGFAQDERDCGVYRTIYDTENGTDFDNNRNYFNGTRKVKPKMIKPETSFELEIIQDLITVVGCIILSLLIIGLIWFFYRVFSKKFQRSQPESDPKSDSANEIHKKRQSIIQMLETRRGTIHFPPEE